MTEENPWGQQPPLAQPKRFDTGRIWLGVVLGIAFTVGVPFLALAAGPPIVGPVLLVLGLGGALVVGIVLAAISGPSTRRGFGLGLVIGWSMSLLIAGSLCVYILSTLEF